MTEPITSQQLGDIAPAGSWGIYEYGNDGSVTDIAAEVQRLRAEAEQRSEDLAAADNPTHLRWGLNDVLWSDDDSVIVLLSGPDREAYWLELDPERAAVLREDLAGPPAEETHIVADDSDDPEHVDDCPGCEAFTLTGHVAAPTT